jgi:hypothetical protein
VYRNERSRRWKNPFQGCGKDHSDVAAALINLKAQSGVERYRRAIAMREAKLGLDDPEVAMVLNNRCHLQAAGAHSSPSTPMWG